jgi:hypothetical protein
MVASNGKMQGTLGKDNSCIHLPRQLLPPPATSPPLIPAPRHSLRLRRPGAGFRGWGRGVVEWLEAELVTEHWLNLARQQAQLVLCPCGKQQRDKLRWGAFLASLWLQ